jgi:transposase
MPLVIVEKKETGCLKVEAVPRSPHKLHDEELLAYVKANPDAYLREIGEHFKCCAAAVHRAFKRLGVVYKKRHLYLERNEERRKRFTDFEPIVHHVLLQM